MRLYVKAEFFNPAGSVKDRLALNIIEAAERDGLIEARDLDSQSLVAEIYRESGRNDQRDGGVHAARLSVILMV